MGASEMPREAEQTPAGSEYDVRVKLFGAVELENNRGCAAENPEWPSLSWLLLKYLLVKPGREAALEELLGNVWPDEPGVDLKNAANLRLRRLRKVLAPLRLDGKDGLVLFHAGAYRLNPRYLLRTDAELFAEQMRRVRKTPADDPDGLEICLEALELYRERFMEHTEEAPWLLKFRKHYAREFHELAHSTLERLRIYENDRVLDLLCRRAVAIIPERETFHQELISCMIQQERQDALVRYISQLSRQREPGADWLEPLEV